MKSSQNQKPLSRNISKPSGSSLAAMCIIFGLILIVAAIANEWRVAAGGIGITLMFIGVSGVKTNGEQPS